MRTLYWARNDLRLGDNAALNDALATGATEICFIVSEAQWRSHDMGDRRLGWIHHALQAFAQQAAQLGVPLRILEIPWFADVPKALLELAQQLGVSKLVYNAEYPLNEQRRDDAVDAALGAAGIEVARFHSNLTLPPGSVMTPAGSPYRAFSAFRKRWLSVAAAIGFEPLPKPQPVGAAITMPRVEALGEYAHTIDPQVWPAGEAAAQQRVNDFVEQRLREYAANRDIPSVPGTSRLSPFLAVGAISANQCLARAQSLGSQGEAWTNELIWREFYQHITALYPHVSKGRPFKPEMDRLVWRDAPVELAAWRAGQTGYPLVDAAMRQLTETGWMHNRLRMVTAMFLTKHLLIDWREGERFFMQQLIDGDFAANNGGWQWSASTGTDSVPYFRIFNPTTQGQRFDPSGIFTRRMLPELAQVPDRHLYAPHDSGIELDYPEPIVDHKAARARALAAFGN